MQSYVFSSRLQSKIRSLFIISGMVMLSGVAFMGCEDDDKMMAPPTPTLQGKSIYGVDAANNLINFGSGNPGTVVRKTAITGMQAGETILGLDVRPSDKKLYALGSTSRVYTVDTTSAAATLVGTGAFTPVLTGASFGFDFNPQADRLRIHTDARQDLRLNLTVSPIVALRDSTLAFTAGDANVAQTPNVVATAYTNNVAMAPSTVLFAIDSNLDILVRLQTPNNGQLTTIGALGVNTNQFTGFDIFGSNDTAYASLTTSANGPSALYSVNLTTGAATLIGNIGNSSPLSGIAVMP